MTTSPRALQTRSLSTPHPYERRNLIFCIAVFALLSHAQISCAQQSYTLPSASRTWADGSQHLTGSHTTKDLTVAQSAVPSRATSTAAVAAVGVQACNILNACGAITFPGATPTGPNLVAKFTANLADSCPAKADKAGGGCSSARKALATQCDPIKQSNCHPPCGSPLMVDVSEDGVGGEDQLTGVKGGIVFDLKCNGKPERIAWTKPGSKYGVLVLPNANGEIKDCRQLFGNFTPQPKSKKFERNGFAALAVYDTVEKGGNGDGLIDIKDPIYSQLRILLGKPNDPNHRLLTLPEAGIENISVSDYYAIDVTDPHTNLGKFEGSANLGFPEPKHRAVIDWWLLNEKTAPDDEK